MRYEAPDNLPEAVALLAQCDGLGKVLAGGTDLLVQLRSGVMEPDLIVDIKHIPGMREIRLGDGKFIIGAAVCGAEMGEHPELSAAWPGVVEAVELIGSTQIQGRATMVGNLCNASPAADSIPAMIAAAAVAHISGPDGERRLAVEEMCTGPGENTLGKGEIVTAVELPAKPTACGDAYLRFIPRTEMDIAVVGVGVCLTLDEAGRCLHARVALGAVAEKPILVPAAAQALTGADTPEQGLDALVAAASAACRPIDDKRGTREFRIKVAGVLARRATTIALARARTI